MKKIRAFVGDLMTDPLFTTGEFNRLKLCRHGYMLYSIHDRYIGRSLDQYGEFCEGEIELLAQLIRPGDIVVDVGANIGTHTVFFARAVGEAGMVIAFEPQRLVHQQLCANVALNSFLNVHTLHLAAGEDTGVLAVPEYNPRLPYNVGGVPLQAQGEGEQVDVVPLDGLNLPHCRLIKADVEGMEEFVMRGAIGLLQTYKPALYLENESPIVPAFKARSDRLIRFLDQLGYKMYWHVVPFFRPNNFAGNPENVFGNVLAVNMICIHEDVTQQAFGFEPVTVPLE